MKRKRIRTPVAKPDHVLVAWGRVDRFDSRPCLVYAYGDRGTKGGSHLLMEALEGARYRPSFRPLGSYTTEKSIVQQLEEEGFDITTLRVTIRKKETGEEVELK